MPMKKYQVHLADDERQHLLALTRKGVHPTRTVTRGRILLLAHEQRPYTMIATYLHTSYPTVSRICQRYCCEFIARTRTLKALKISGPGKEHLTVLMACSL